MNLVDDLNQRKSDGLYRNRRAINSSQGPLIEIDGKDYLNFSSNDYLGLANNDVLKGSMIEAIKEYGLGAGSSQLVVGYSAPHKSLEKRLAEFLNRDAALVFSSGYLANLAIASVLIDSNTIVLQDKLNHASLIDAAQLSKGRLVRYRHGNIDHLKTLLEKYKQYNLVLMTDGVFSMDGDFAPVVELAKLCKAYDVIMIVDDAHGLGVLGDRGAGLLELQNLDQSQVPLLIGTFGKSFGGSGAFISGSALYVDAFIQKARTYIYTTAMLPSLAVAMTQAVGLVENAVDLRQNLSNLIEHYKKLMREESLDTRNSFSPIQPFIVGSANKTVELSDALFQNHILAAAIRPPTVPKDTSRLRLTFSAIHNKGQVASLVQGIKNNLNE
ncbi:MAG: 8-amino-7-oxononanoate synthase [Gammaproteobacteria bacterium]